MNSQNFYSKAVLRVIRPSGDARGTTKEYLVHQLVADLFPDQPVRGYLYRVTQDRPGGAEVLILSSAPPREAFERPVRDWGCALGVESKPFVPQLQQGQRVDYEIRINATTSVDGRRTDVWDAVFAADRKDPRSPPQVYHSFLVGKLDDAAEVLSTHVVERGLVSIRRGLQKQRPITFVSTNLVGTLRIDDPINFLQILVEGIGRAKGFGHGLLCLSNPGSVLRRTTPHATTQT